LLLCGLVAIQCAHAEAARAVTPDAAAGSRASALLVKMAEAVRSLNYEGTLVYLHQNRLETLSLHHRVEHGQIEERLISLNGPIRAVARAKDRVNCVLPDGQPISVQREGGSRFLDTDGIDPEALAAHYRVEMLGGARIAGRETDVVGIIPRDDMRYGYRFHIDRETALPLKSDLIDRRQEPIEQLMFTAINFLPSDGSALQVPVASLRAAPATTPDSQWRFESVPPGFELVMQHRLNQPDGSVIEHFLFTDRLSSYSIYIEPGLDDGLDGVASIGAVHAAGGRLGEHQVIAVGEVPPETVRAAIAGTRRVATPESARP
jgi:sigma-E factor negative regulatory protein RseB